MPNYWISDLLRTYTRPCEISTHVNNYEYQKRKASPYKIGTQAVYTPRSWVQPLATSSGGRVNAQLAGKRLAGVAPEMSLEDPVHTSG